MSPGYRNRENLKETPAPKSISICSKTLNDFSSDVKALWATPIRILETVPEPTDFYREFVSLSKPVLIRDAFPKTSLDDIISAMGDEELRLNVDVTPDGHGDCIRVLNGERLFVMPETREMSLTDLRDGLRQQQKRRRNEGKLHEKDENGLRMFYDEEDDIDRQANSQRLEGTLHSSLVEEDEVFYYSRQNDCLRNELKPFLNRNLFPQSISFANDAFNDEPEAVNVWIGNEKSVSSMHKDHYENIFCVANGEKVFTICPPSDSLFLTESTFPSGVFKKGKRDGAYHWKISRLMDDENNCSSQKVRWVESNVECMLLHDDKGAPNNNPHAHEKHYPFLKYANPYRVHVKAGDMLYLPPLWYHQVTSTCETVAVNYWYPMRFDSPQWCYFNMLQQLNNKS